MSGIQVFLADHSESGELRCILSAGDSVDFRGESTIVARASPYFVMIVTIEKVELTIERPDMATLRTLVFILVARHSIVYFGVDHRDTSDLEYRTVLVPAVFAFRRLKMDLGCGSFKERCRKLHAIASIDERRSF
jgi:hypothetical protein